MGLFDFLGKKKELPPQHSLVQSATREGFRMYLENIRAAKLEFSDSDKGWLLRLHEIEAPAVPGIENMLARFGEVRYIGHDRYLLIARPKVTREQIGDFVRALAETDPGTNFGYSSLDKEVFA